MPLPAVSTTNRHALNLVSSPVSGIVMPSRSVAAPGVFFWRWRKISMTAVVTERIAQNARFKTTALPQVENDLGGGKR